MNAAEPNGMNILEKTIMGQILKEYDHANNFALFTPVIPDELQDPDDPVSPLDVILKIFDAKITLTKDSASMSFPIIYKYKPFEDGSVKLVLGNDFLRLIGNKGLSDNF